MHFKSKQWFFFCLLSLPLSTVNEDVVCCKWIGLSKWENPIPSFSWGKYLPQQRVCLGFDAFPSKGQLLNAVLCSLTTSRALHCTGSCFAARSNQAQFVIKTAAPHCLLLLTTTRLESAQETQRKQKLRIFPSSPFNEGIWHSGYCYSCSNWQRHTHIYGTAHHA